MVSASSSSSAGNVGLRGAPPAGHRVVITPLLLGNVHHGAEVAALSVGGRRRRSNGRLVVVMVVAAASPAAAHKVRLGVRVGHADGGEAGGPLAGAVRGGGGHVAAVVEGHRDLPVEGLHSSPVVVVVVGVVQRGQVEAGLALPRGRGGPVSRLPVMLLRIVAAAVVLGPVEEIPAVPVPLLALLVRQQAGRVVLALVAEPHRGRGLRVALQVVVAVAVVVVGCGIGVAGDHGAVVPVRLLAVLVVQHF